MMVALRSAFVILPDSEITLEINPGTVDQAYLDALRELGINRLSIGMQSAIEGELGLFERDHTLADVERTVRLARRAGFQNLSFDLIYGAPQQRLTDWEYTLDYAASLAPEHYSLYALQLESGTKLKRLVKAGDLPEPDDDLAADMYDLASQKLAAQGFEHYEISSWAKPGYGSRHNLQYWRNLPYLGLGAGAHGYAGGFRTVNIMRPECYIERLNATSTNYPYPRTPATQTCEAVSREQEIFETIMLGLRMLTEGLSYPLFEDRFGMSLEALHGETIAYFKRQGLLCEKDDALLLTPRAYLISNRVLQAFVPEEV
jgi:oxygen-independent coproporphyrinogen-3 oxidase